MLLIVFALTIYGALQSRVVSGTSVNIKNVFCFVVEFQLKLGSSLDTRVFHFLPGLTSENIISSREKEPAMQCFIHKVGASSTV